MKDWNENTYIKKCFICSSINIITSNGLGLKGLTITKNLHRLLYIFSFMWKAFSDTCQWLTARFSAAKICTALHLKTWSGFLYLRGIDVIAESQGKYPAVNMIFLQENVAVLKKATVFFSYYQLINCHFSSVINLSQLPDVLKYWIFELESMNYSCFWAIKLSCTKTKQWY